MSIVASVAAFCKPWADLYSSSKPVETVVTFAHLGGLLVSGGIAIAVDRASLRVLGRPAEERAVHLRELAAVHRPVVIGLVVVTLSGLLLFAADVDTYAASVTFWVKMGLIAVLTLNGILMQRAERRLDRDGDDVPAWRRLRRTSMASRALWLLTTLAGVMLVNAA